MYNTENREATQIKMGYFPRIKNRRQILLTKVYSKVTGSQMSSIRKVTRRVQRGRRTMSHSYYLRSVSPEVRLREHGHFKSFFALVYTVKARA